MVETRGRPEVERAAGREEKQPVRSHGVPDTADGHRRPGAVVAVQAPKSRGIGDAHPFAGVQLDQVGAEKPDPDSGEIGDGHAQSMSFADAGTMSEWTPPCARNSPRGSWTRP